MSSERTTLLPVKQSQFDGEVLDDESTGVDGDDKLPPRASFWSFFKAMIPVTLVAFGGPQVRWNLAIRKAPPK